MVACWSSASLKAPPLPEGFLFHGRKAGARECVTNIANVSDDVLCPGLYASGCPRHIQVHSVSKGLPIFYIFCSSSACVSCLRYCHRVVEITCFH